MSSLSERLRLAMDRAGVQRKDIQRATGVKQPSVHYWLTGRTRSLRGDNLVLLAQFLDVSESWLADGVGSMERHNENWPFEEIDANKVRRLPRDERIRLETAILFYAMGRGLDVGVTAPALRDKDDPDQAQNVA